MSHSSANESMFHRRRPACLARSNRCASSTESRPGIRTPAAHGEPRCPGHASPVDKDQQRVNELTSASPWLSRAANSIQKVVEGRVRGLRKREHGDVRDRHIPSWRPQQSQCCRRAGRRCPLRQSHRRLPEPPAGSRGIDLDLLRVSDVARARQARAEIAVRPSGPDRLCRLGSGRIGLGARGSLRVGSRVGVTVSHHDAEPAQCE